VLEPIVTLENEQVAMEGMREILRRHSTWQRGRQ
jgi:hypothetical protein